MNASPFTPGAVRTGNLAQWQKRLRPPAIIKLEQRTTAPPAHLKVANN